MDLNISIQYSFHCIPQVKGFLAKDTEGSGLFVQGGTSHIILLYTFSNLLIGLTALCECF